MTPAKADIVLITLCILRWINSGDVQELNSILFYLDSFRKQLTRWQVFKRKIWWFWHKKALLQMINNFADAQEMPFIERSIIINVSGWHSRRDLFRARSLVQELINKGHMGGM